MMQPRMRVLQEHNITAHEQLFQDSVRRQARQEEYQSWYPDDATFQPELVARPGTAGSLPPSQRGGSANSPVTSHFRVLSPRQSAGTAPQRLLAYQRKKEVRALRCTCSTQIVLAQYT